MLILNDSYENNINDADDMNTPGRKIKIPKNIPLNEKREYNKFNMIPIPNPFRKTNKNAPIVPMNVKEIQKTRAIIPTSLEIIAPKNTNLSYPTINLSLEMLIPDTNDERKKHPNAIPQ